MATPEALRAHADEMIDRLEATRTIAAECEHFGLLAEELVQWSDGRRPKIEKEARELLARSYAGVLAVVSPTQRGEAGEWRKSTAARYVDGVDSAGLVDALRAVTRVRVAVERVKG